LLDSVQAHRIVFAFICRFPPGGRILRVIDENIPTTRHVIDPKRCVYYAAALRTQLQKNRINGDLDRLNWTNWVSVAAAISGLIGQFNKGQEKRAQRDYPVREAVSKAVAKPFYFKRTEEPPQEMPVIERMVLQLSSINVSNPTEEEDHDEPSDAGPGGVDPTGGEVPPGST